MLREEVSGLLQVEQAIQQLSDFYHRGRQLYSEHDDFHSWQTKMDAWKNEVEQFISEAFSVSELHEFRKEGSGFEYTTEWKWGDEVASREAWIAKARVSARLSALNDLVRHSASGFFPHKMRLRELLQKTDGTNQIKGV